MMTSIDTAVVGGALALLTLGHFVFDWLFQSHSEALSKSKVASVRAGHCITYSALMTVAFATIFNMWSWSNWICPVVFLWLFFTHFIIDTYAPVKWWVLLVRRPPFKKIFDPGTFSHVELDNDEKFAAFAATHLGLLISIVVDQIFHIMCLIPPAVLAFVR